MSCGFCDRRHNLTPREISRSQNDLNRLVGVLPAQVCSAVSLPAVSFINDCSACANSIQHVGKLGLKVGDADGFHGNSG